MMPRYLYLSGDPPFVIEDEPTADDLMTVARGVITIIRLDDGCVYTGDDEWEAIGTRIGDFESIRLLNEATRPKPTFC